MKIFIPQSDVDYIKEMLGDKEYSYHFDSDHLICIEDVLDHQATVIAVICNVYIPIKEPSVYNLPYIAIDWSSQSFLREFQGVKGYVYNVGMRCRECGAIEYFKDYNPDDYKYRIGSYLRVYRPLCNYCKEEVMAK